MPATAKTKLPTGATRKRDPPPDQTSSTGTTMASANGLHRKRKIPPKTDGWQKHTESVKGYYYWLESDWHVFVCLYRNEVRIHIREYYKVPDGTLVPTKTGATLWEEDFAMLSEIGPKAYENWKEMSGDSGDEILNHPLSDRSDYYMIVGPDENGQLKFCVKICYPTNDGESLTSTYSGATMTLAGWNKLLEQREEIATSVESMKKNIVS